MQGLIVARNSCALDMMGQDLMDTLGVPEVMVDWA